MLEHSERYKKYSEPSGAVGVEDFLQLKTGDPTLFHDLACGTLGFSEFENLLREDIDAKFNIVSREIKDPAKTVYPTGVAWVRDATQARPVNQSISDDHPLIEANNTLLRCLSRLRGVDYALSQDPNLAKNRENLRSNLALLTKHMLMVAKDSHQSKKDKYEQFKELEAQFDSFLVQTLYDAGLTKGCEKKADFEALLFHYRNLASLIEPAEAMVTILHDQKNNVLRRTTQYPVTTKRKAQKTAIQEMQQAPAKGKGYHQSSNEAFQQANNIFADLLLKDDRCLPAQARKTHLPTAKNAYIVKNEIVQLAADSDPKNYLTVQDLNPDNTLWNARSGSPVYVGKGETEERFKEHAYENIAQIVDAANAISGKSFEGVNGICLLTESKTENQKRVIRVVKELEKSAKTRVPSESVANTKPASNLLIATIPVNLQGASLEDAKIPAEMLPEGRAWVDLKTHKSSLGKKRERVEVAASVVVSIKPQFLTWVFCQSGQDRTGTVIEAAMQLWTLIRYKVLKFFGSSESEKETAKSAIQELSVAGRNAVEMATQTAPGSRGMKTDSKPEGPLDEEGLFPEHIQDALYLKSAETNKKNPVWKKPTKEGIKNAWFSRSLEQEVITLLPNEFWDKWTTRSNVIPDTFSTDYTLLPETSPSSHKFYGDVGRGFYSHGKRWGEIYQEKTSQNWDDAKSQDQTAQTEMDNSIEAILLGNKASDEDKKIFRTQYGLFKKQYSQSLSLLLLFPFSERGFDIPYCQRKFQVYWDATQKKLGVLAEIKFETIRNKEKDSLWGLASTVTADWKQDSTKAGLRLDSLKISGVDRKLTESFFSKGDVSDFLPIGLLNIKALSNADYTDPVEKKPFYQRWLIKSKTLFRAADTKELDRLVAAFVSHGENLKRGNTTALYSSITEYSLVEIFNAASKWLDKRDNAFLGIYFDDIYPAVQELRDAAEYGLYKANQAYSPNDSIERALNNAEKFIAQLGRQGITNSTGIKEIQTIVEKVRLNLDRDSVQAFIDMRAIVREITSDTLRNWWSELRIPWLGKKGRHPSVKKFYNDLLNTSLILPNVPLQEAKDKYVEKRGELYDWFNIDNFNVLFDRLEKTGLHSIENFSQKVEASLVEEKRAPKSPGGIVNALGGGVGVRDEDTEKVVVGDVLHKEEKKEKLETTSGSVKAPGMTLGSKDDKS